MTEHVVVRGIAGPLNGEVRQLPGGNTWRVGTPPLVLLTILGEGLVRVEPMRDGVQLAGRPLLGPETISAEDAPQTLELPDGSTLWMARSTAPIHAATRDGSALLLELDALAGAPASTSASGGWRIPRPRLRLPHVALPWRVSRPSPPRS